MLFFSLLLLPSCISNDIPYPVRKTEITAMEVEMGSVNINPSACKVTISLQEQADPSAVRIISMECSDGMTVITPSPEGVFDLRTPVQFKLTTYQDYFWSVVAEQKIERNFSVEGQVGPAVIDDVNHRVMLQVRSTVPLDAVRVISCKLGPADVSTYTPVLSGAVDFTDVVAVGVSYRGVNEVWTIYVEQTEVSVRMITIDPRTCSAYFCASGIEGEQNGFRYRKIGDSSWTEVNCGTAASFSFFVTGLQGETSYECQAFSGDSSTEPVAFTTEKALQLPNSGFNVFSKAESKNYFSFYDLSSTDLSLQTKWWDSGNAGSTTVGAAYTICEPDLSDKKEGAASAHLISRNVIIKFAAGNLFSGSFGGTIGTSGGIVNFGRPFTLRPSAVKLWLKYNPGRLDCIGSLPSGVTLNQGDPDTGRIFVALGDWNYRIYGGTPESPVRVNTTDIRNTAFDSGSEAVIAYGEWASSKSTDGWIEVEIPLDYKDNNRKPTHIIISCAASSLGDYFTGSSSSEMWVDDFRFIY